MACTSCKSTTIVTGCTSGCSSTVDTDCIIYDDARLSYESTDIESGDKRTLTDILQSQDAASCPKVTSKIVEFSTVTGSEVTSYTVVADDICKTILLTQVDDEASGTTITNTIILPQTNDFIDREIVIKDISAPATGNTIVFQFNIAIQYQWNPSAATTQLLSNLWDSHRVIKLRYVKVTETSYQWLVV